MVFQGSGLKILDDLINIIINHYYLSILIIGSITIIVSVLIMIKKKEGNEGNKKPSIIMEFFSVLNDVFKTK